jgi:hypothetical protein
LHAWEVALRAHGVQPSGSSEGRVGSPALRPDALIRGRLSTGAAQCSTVIPEMSQGARMPEAANGRRRFRLHPWNELGSTGSAPRFARPVLTHCPQTPSRPSACAACARIDGGCNETGRYGRLRARNARGRLRGGNPARLFRRDTTAFARGFCRNGSASWSKRFAGTSDGRVRLYSPGYRLG